jgi:hypothetical protein
MDKESIGLWLRIRENIRGQQELIIFLEHIRSLQVLS